MSNEEAELLYDEMLAHYGKLPNHIHETEQ